MDESNTGYGLIKLERYRAQSDKKKLIENLLIFSYVYVATMKFSPKKKKRK